MVETKELVNKVFPCGNYWMYPAGAIFVISILKISLLLPALLTSCAYALYGEDWSTVLLTTDLIIFLLNALFCLNIGLFGFLVVSGITDIYNTFGDING